MKYKVLKNFNFDGKGLWAKGFANNSWFSDDSPLMREFVDFLLKGGFIEELPEKKGGRIWIPEAKKGYFYAGYFGTGKKLYYQQKMDKFNLAIGNMFETEADAAFYLKKLKALAKIKKYIADNFEPWEPNWDDSSEEKFFIYYLCSSESLDWSYTNVDREGLVLPYFKTSDEAIEVIDKFEPELRVIFGLEEEGK
jgi:hypothetical protein